VESFNVGQTTAVATAFRLAGYDGPLIVASEFKGDERVFVVSPEVRATLRDARGLEQLVGQILSRKVAIADTTQYPRATEMFE
jgi:hypothetical protein